MFGRQKVKTHNRLTKTSKGFKVIRVQEFFRKDDDNSARNMLIGAGAVALVGATILLKKKGIAPLLKKKTKNMVVKVDDVDNLNLTPRPGYNEKFDKNILESYKIPTPDKKKVTEEVVSKTAKNNEEIIKDMTSVLDETSVKTPTETIIKPDTTTNNVIKTPSEQTVKKTFDQLPDPWKTPIPSKSGVRGTKLLTKKPVTGKRISKSRLLSKKGEGSVSLISNPKKKDLT